MAEQKHAPWEWSVGAGATVIVWYALPDLVRNRGVRALVKIGLLGVTAYGASMVPNTWEDASELPSRIEAQLAELPKAASTGLLVGGLTALTAASILFEKAAFARGERRRSKGVRCAHTRQAVAIAAATAAAVFVPDSATEGL